LKLYIMRHGSAEDDSATGRDADRILTPKGRDRVRAVAEKLVADGEAPSLIVTSPLARAEETARIVREVTKSRAPLEVRDELAGHGVVKEMALVRELVERCSGVHGADGAQAAPGAHAASILLVGHQPGLSELVIELTQSSVAFDKAMVVAIEVANGPYTVRFVLEPKTLDYRAMPQRGARPLDS
jgi:phosphohistidine phosphatase